MIKQRCEEKDAGAQCNQTAFALVDVENVRERWLCTPHQAGHGTQGRVVKLVR